MINNRTKNASVLLVCLMWGVLAGKAGHSIVYAQQYVFDTGDNNAYQHPQEIDNIKNLQYVFGILSSGQENADYYKLDVADPTTLLTVGLLVPKTNNQSSSQPNLLLVDAGSAQMIGPPPSNFPPHIGGRVYQWPLNGNRESKTEAFGRFWSGPKVVKRLVSGKYILAVYDLQGGGGKYVLKIGNQKQPDRVRDYFFKTVALIRIKLSLY